MKLKYASIDITRAPIIYVKFVAKVPNREEFEDYLSDLTAMQEKYTGCVFIIDGSQSLYLPGEFRAKQIDWINKHRDTMERNCLGLVYVIQSITIELVFRCIIKFSPMPVPYVTCRTLERAEEEARKMLAVTK